MRSAHIRNRGFTLIELMVVGALLVILLTLAVPSFQAFFAKKRIEGMAASLVTDLELARSEAVARNTLVQVSLGTGCYVIHALPANATTFSTGTSCTASSVTIGAGETELKRFQVRSDLPATLSPSGSLAAVLFDPVRGLPRFSPAGGAAAVDVSSTIGSWALRVQVARNGSSRVCSPNGSVAGVPSCS